MTTAAAGGIRYLWGDATRPVGPPPAIVAHVVNDRGLWGRGFERAVSARWPAPASFYRAWFANRRRNDFGLGAVQFVAAGVGVWVANMVAQSGLRSAGNPTPLRYGALERCLDAVARKALDWGAAVHMPRLGAGLANGSWDRVSAAVARSLALAGVPVTVYDLEPDA